MKRIVEKNSDSEDLRCLCGNLVARIIKDQIELKCKRCKRIHLIPLQSGGDLRAAKKHPKSQEKKGTEGRKKTEVPRPES